MHAFLCVMSPRYSQSPEFPLTALIKAVVSGTGREDDFINDLINHQNSPSPHISLLCILPVHHSSFSFFKSPTSRTHTHIYLEAHTPALFQDTATQVALSFFSVPLTSTCSLPDQRAAKVPKSNVTTIQEASLSVNYHHKRTTVSQPVQN